MSQQLFEEHKPDEAQDVRKQDERAKGEEEAYRIIEPLASRLHEIGVIINRLKELPSNSEITFQLDKELILRELGEIFLDLSIEINSANSGPRTNKKKIQFQVLREGEQELKSTLVDIMNTMIFL